MTTVKVQAMTTTVKVQAVTTQTRQQSIRPMLYKYCNTFIKYYVGGKSSNNGGWRDYDQNTLENEQPKLKGRAHMKNKLLRCSILIPLFLRGETSRIHTSRIVHIPCIEFNNAYNGNLDNTYRDLEKLHVFYFQRGLK